MTPGEGGNRKMLAGNGVELFGENACGSCFACRPAERIEGVLHFLHGAGIGDFPLCHPERGDDPRVPGDLIAVVSVIKVVEIMRVARIAADRCLHAERLVERVHGGNDAIVVRRQEIKLPEEHQTGIGREIPFDFLAVFPLDLLYESSGFFVVEVEENRGTHFVRGGMVLLRMGYMAECLRDFGGGKESGVRCRTGITENAVMLFPRIVARERKFCFRLAVTDHERRCLFYEALIHFLQPFEIVHDFEVVPHSKEHESGFVLLNGELHVAVFVPWVP